MSGVLKVMSGQDMDDSSPFKNFDLYSIAEGGKISFRQNSAGLDVVVISNPEQDSEEVILYGNAYMMSNSGKTIASRGTNVPSTLPPNPTPVQMAVSALLGCSSDAGELFDALDNVGHRYTAIYGEMAKAIWSAANPELPILAEGEGYVEAEPATPEYEAKQAIASLTPKKESLSVSGLRSDRPINDMADYGVEELKHVLLEVAKRNHSLYTAMAIALDHGINPGNDSARAASAKPFAIGAFNELAVKFPVEIGRALGALNYNAAIEALFHADNFCERQENTFVMAMGEYLGSLAKKGDERAISTLIYAASHIPGVAQTETEALNKGRGKEFAKFGTPPNLIEIQNKAAISAVMAGERGGMTCVDRPHDASHASMRAAGATETHVGRSSVS